MRTKAKSFASYLAKLPEKRITLTLTRPTACVHDYSEGEFETDLVAVGAVIDGVTYIDGFEMTPETKNVLMLVQGGKKVTATLVADDGDPDNFPSIVDASEVQ